MCRLLTPALAHIISRRDKGTTMCVLFAVPPHSAEHARCIVCAQCSLSMCDGDDSDNNVRALCSATHFAAL
jgi:hypothetical protein